MAARRLATYHDGPLSPVLTHPMTAPSLSARAPGAAAGKAPPDDERAMLVTLYAQGRYADAEAIALDFTRRFPKHVLGWKVLGAVLQQTGRLAESIAPLQKAVAASPRDHEAFNNLGVAHKKLGRLANATGAFEQAVALNPAFAVAWSNLGSAWHDQGQLAKALRCYRQVLALTPDDLNARHHVSALSGQTTERAPAPYVSGVFDHYAPTFDTHLQTHLAYGVPQEIARLLPLHAPAGAPPWAVLDLGCGTGLVGQALAGGPACEVVGVDLSARMLAFAQAKGAYQRLVQADLLAMMEGEAEASYDVVTSADVFIYVGRIDREVAAIRRLLKPGGVFAFSVESWQPHAGQAGPGFVLQPTCRYAHSAAYLDGLARTHGFEVVHHEALRLRKDGDVDVPGWVQLWRLPGA